MQKTDKIDIAGSKGAILCDRSKPDGAPGRLPDSGGFRAYGRVPEMNIEAGIKDSCPWYLDKIVSREVKW